MKEDDERASGQDRHGENPLASATILALFIPCFIPWAESYKAALHQQSIDPWGNAEVRAKSPRAHRFKSQNSKAIWLI